MACVLSEEPYACVLQQSQRGLRCDSCFEIVENLKKCTACNVLRYCNVICQKSDWMIHKTECKCLRQVSPNIPLDSVRLMLRIIIRIQSSSNTEQSTIYNIPESWRRKFSDLKSHVKEIENDRERREQFTKIAYTLHKLTQSIFNLPTTTDLFEIFGKMVINSFTIFDGEMQSIGVGVYIGGSKLDHSCNPNAVITFIGKTLQLRTLEPVKELLPSQLRISYIDLLSVTSDRRKQLQQQYYFDCDCSRCLHIELDGLMMCVKCQNDLCQDGYLPQTTDSTYLPCCSCAWHSSDSKFLTEVSHYQNDLSEMLQKLKEMDKNKDKTDILQHCNTFLEANLRYVHIYNITCVKIEDKAFDLCIDLQLWEEALQHGQKTLTAYRMYYPANSPNLGIQLMKVGKIQLYLGKLQDSFKTFTQAENILSVTHGEKHCIYGQLKDLMYQNCEELRSQKQP